MGNGETATISPEELIELEKISIAVDKSNAAGGNYADDIAITIDPKDI